MERADVIIIGSGQAGVPLAADWANEGKRVVLFERGALGGSCVNYGCTPSKALLGAAHAAGRARQAEKLGIHADLRIDFPAVMKRVREIREQWRSGVEKRLEKAKVRVVAAEASFAGLGKVRGGDVEVEAPLIVINTGTGPASPSIPGLNGLPYLTSNNIFDLEELPERTVVIGGGYVGLELGQGLARLGSQVTIVNTESHLLAHEESDVGEALAEAFERDGIELRLSAETTEISKDKSEYRIQLKSGEELRSDALLIATGRQPNTSSLNAEAAGVKLDDQGFIKIDDQFWTGAHGVFAVGDAARQPAFTHVSYEDYRRLKAIVAGGSRTRDDRALAYAVYTEPQVGRVGLTEKQAAEKGYQPRSVTMPVTKIARAVEWGHDIGFYRLVVCRKTDKILGAALVGYEAAELVHVLLAHIEAGSTWHRLDESVHIHPTYGEGLPSLARLLNDPE